MDEEMQKQINDSANIDWQPSFEEKTKQAYQEIVEVLKKHNLTIETGSQNTILLKEGDRETDFRLPTSPDQINYWK